jgi:hypothetical protein
MQPKKKKIEKPVPTVGKKKLTQDLEVSDEQLKKVRGGMVSTGSDPTGGDPSEPIPM